MVTIIVVAFHFMKILGFGKEFILFLSLMFYKIKNFEEANN